MFIIALVVLWNSLILWVTVGSIAWLLLSHLSFSVIGWFALLFTFLMAIFAASPIGDIILKLPLSSRRPIEREQNRLEPLLAKLRVEIRAKRGRFIVCDVLISEVAYPYIQTLGRHTLIVPRHLLDSLSDKALMAGIASAMGRFYDRHSVYYSMSLGASFLGQTIQNIVQWFALTITRIGYRHIWLLPFGFIGSLLTFLLKGFQITSVLIMKAYVRRCVYRSDQFSRSLGLQTSLIAYLEVLAQQEVRQDGFLEKYQQRFPSAMQRIGALEKI